MKQRNIIIIAIILIFIGSGSFLYIINNRKDISDSTKFKKEYEILNDKKDSSGNTYMELNLPNASNIKYTTQEEVIDILKNKTGIIYFGFPECPWCRNIVTPLLEVIKDNEIDTLYYYNNREDRDIKSLDDNGNVVTEKEGTAGYHEIVDLLKDHLGEYKGLNDNSIKRLYYPTVVFIKDGKIIGLHIGTVKSHTVGKTPLNDSQLKELKDIYQGYIDQVYGGVCDSTC